MLSTLLLQRFMPENLANPIHELFRLCGCDLDYMPMHKYEAIMQGFQFLAAAWFITMFVRFLYKLTCNLLTGGKI